MNVEETLTYLDSLPGHFGWTVENLIRLLLAGLAGAAVGLEREFRGRGAGLRTFMLVSVGAALVMVVSVNFAYATWPDQNEDVLRIDPGRVAYGVMTGIGFLGAGTIIRSRGNITGLMTAAGIWATAAVGLAFGLGLYVVAIIATLVLFATLYLIGVWERIIPITRDVHVVLRLQYKPDLIGQLKRELQPLGLHLRHPGFRRESPDSRTADCHFDLRIRGNQPVTDLEKWAANRGDVSILAVE